jgi:outer membrane protein assembly factor BamA
MKRLYLLLLLVSASIADAAPPAVLQASTQRGTIENVQITGVSDESLSQDLRNSIQTLVGQQYDADAAAGLAARIEREVPDVVAAPRVQAGSSPGSVRLIFVVAHAESAEVDANVNSQYTVESVEVIHLDRSQYSDAIYQDMQKMVGQKLDNDRLEDIRIRLLSELHGQYFVRQKIERGSQPEHVKVIFDIEKAPWIFRSTIGKVFGGNIRLGDTELGQASRDRDSVEAVEVEGVPRSQVSDALYGEMQMMVGKRVDQLEIKHLREKLRLELKDEFEVTSHTRSGTEDRQARIVFKAERIPWLPYRNPATEFGYHPKQGWTFVCCNGAFIGPYTTIAVAWDGNNLVERYKGFGFGLESTSLGNRRIGGRLQFESWGVQWKPQTRLAVENNPQIPGLYRSRIGLAPSVAFAFNRNVFVTAGANFTQLEMENESSGWESAHAGVASINYDSKKVQRGKTYFHHLTTYEVRTGARSIGSDFSYTRHRFDHSSTFGYGEHSLQVTFAGGKITGNPPLFERFSLGDLETLRGWNKYDIAPAGGTRVWHGSVTYRYSEVGFFTDVGDIWNPGIPHDVRSSVGITLFKFLGMGVPLVCSQQCGPTFFVHFQ